MHIVLIEPEIPGNTGNIIRLCAATGIELHLIEPLGFELTEKHVRRSAMDYWVLTKLHLHRNFAEFQRRYPKARCHFATTKAARTHSDARYQLDDFLVFGKESAGIPLSILQQHEKFCIRIPMMEDTRSLNLSNAAAIVAYEAMRQMEYRNLSCGTGELLQG